METTNEMVRRVFALFSFFCNKEQTSVSEDLVSHNCYFLCAVSYVYAVII